MADAMNGHRASFPAERASCSHFTSINSEWVSLSTKTSGVWLRSLRPLFDKTCVLAVLIARLGVLPLSKPVRGESFVAGPPRALLAFSAALLFVSDWNVEKALSVFAEIHAQPVPEDLAQANIMGLNPFHDFAALEALRFASGLHPADHQYPYAFSAELAAAEQRIISAIK